MSDRTSGPSILKVYLASTDERARRRHVAVAFFFMLWLLVFLARGYQVNMEEPRQLMFRLADVLERPEQTSLSDFHLPSLRAQFSEEMQAVLIEDFSATNHPDPAAASEQLFQQAQSWLSDDVTVIEIIRRRLARVADTSANLQWEANGGQRILRAQSLCLVVERMPSWQVVGMQRCTGS